VESCNDDCMQYGHPEQCGPSERQQTGARSVHFWH